MTGVRDRPRVGVSSCLLGEEVRFNGGHKRYRFLTDSLDPYVDWVPYCPEMEIGLDTPREAIRLTAAGRLVDRGGPRPHRGDGGPALPADLDGYVFKAKSPSCGIRADPRYRDDGHPAGSGPAFPPNGCWRGYRAGHRGRGRLNDPGRREASPSGSSPRPGCVRCGGGGPSRGTGSRPARHKLQLLAHDPARYRRRARWWPRPARGIPPRVPGTVPGRDGGPGQPRPPRQRAAAQRMAGSAGSSTGRGGPTWWPGSRLTGAARSRSKSRSRCSPTTPAAASSLAGGADLPAAVPG